MIAQRKELFFRGIAGRVFALSGKREFRAGAEHVAMRIDRAFRDLEARLRRAGIPVEPARCFFKSYSHQLFFAFLDLMSAKILSASIRQSALRANPFVPRSPNRPSSAKSATQACRSAVPCDDHGSRPASRTVSATSRTSSLRRRP